MSRIADTGTIMIFRTLAVAVWITAVVATLDPRAASVSSSQPGLCGSGGQAQQVFCWPAAPALTYAVARTQASSVPKYAPASTQLTHLLSSQTYKTWASIASPTDSKASYGNVAWSSLWKGLNYTTRLPISTTVSATSVAKTELIKPSPLPYPTTNTSSQLLPEGFFWGFAGSAIQVEGALNREGRTPSVLEQTFAELAAVGIKSSSPAVSAMNYYLYKQDIARLAAAGVQSYSFSISWPRILPFGFPGSPINQQGIDHYNDVINTVIAHGMTPIVTLMHFDPPKFYATATSAFGYDHPHFVDGFFNYAKICVAHFGDRVGYWISFNEPNGDAVLGSNYATVYPVTMAHATVVNWYRNVANGTGKWSMKLQFTSGFGVPLDPTNPSDIVAVNRYLDYQIGYYANPLYLGLQVPQSLSSLGSKAPPKYTASELALINGTCDFFAVDLYLSSYITSPPGGLAACANNSDSPYSPLCISVATDRNGWEVGYLSNSYPRITPQYVRTFFSWISKTYQPSGGIAVMEFGFPSYGDANRTLDAERDNLPQSTYYISFLNEMLLSIYEDGVNVIGAIAWAFIDNWEFGDYTQHYGVQTLNLTTLQRTYKSTLFHYVDWMVGHGG